MLGFYRRGLSYDFRKWFFVFFGGMGEFFFWKIFKMEVFGNGIFVF